MKIEHHQQRVRETVAALNAALYDAASDGVFPEFSPKTADHHERIYLKLNISGWELAEPQVKP